ncbi:MAG: signal peptidase II [Chlamydiota bacterium]
MKRGWWLFLLAATLFLADFFLKSYVSQNIPLMSHASPFYPYGGIPVFHHFCGISFSINHVLNRGAAWGMFASFQEVLLYLRIVVISGLFIHVLFFNRDRFKDIPFVLIITGAISNVVDYFVYGQVVDMFYFTFGSYSFPLFNIADSAIFSGVALLLLISLFKKN